MLYGTIEKVWNFATLDLFQYCIFRDSSL